MGNVVALAGSSVAESSAVTYASARRRVLKFSWKQLGLREDVVLPRAPGLDLNPEVSIEQDERHCATSRPFVPLPCSIDIKIGLNTCTRCFASSCDTPHVHVPPPV